MKILFFIFFALSLNVRAEDTMTCGKNTIEDKTFTYCITQTLGSTSQDLMYYMHGARGSETEWNTGLRRLKAYWAENNIEAPRVVSFSFGERWLLNSTPEDNLLSFTTSNVIPYLENLVGPFSRRVILGTSMGGHNALQLLLKTPLRFERTALHCPLVLSISPFATDEQVNNYIERTQATALNVLGVLNLLKTSFSTEQAWSLSNPLELGNEKFNPELTHLFVGANSKDEMGFFEGARMIHALAQSKGMTSVYSETDATHCQNYDPKALAEFLTN